eukprot:1722636-Amphidinium_carterae.1
MELCMHPYISAPTLLQPLDEEHSPLTTDLYLQDCGLLFTHAPSLSEFPVRRPASPAPLPRRSARRKTLSTLHHEALCPTTPSASQFSEMSTPMSANRPRGSSWMESRDGSSALAKLVSRRFDDMNVGVPLSNADADLSVLDIESPGEWSRRFTTHGASSEDADTPQQAR